MLWYTIFSSSKCNQCCSKNINKSTFIFVQKVVFLCRTIMLFPSSPFFMLSIPCSINIEYREDYICLLTNILSKHFYDPSFFLLHLLFYDVLMLFKYLLNTLALGLTTYHTLQKLFILLCPLISNWHFSPQKFLSFP